MSKTFSLRGAAGDLLAVDNERGYKRIRLAAEIGGEDVTLDFASSSEDGNTPLLDYFLDGEVEITVRKTGQDCDGTECRGKCYSPCGDDKRLGIKERYEALGRRVNEEAEKEAETEDTPERSSWLDEEVGTYRDMFDALLACRLKNNASRGVCCDSDDVEAASELFMILMDLYRELSGTDPYMVLDLDTVLDGKFGGKDEDDEVLDEPVDECSAADAVRKDIETFLELLKKLDED